jgi:hypothetical protein
MWGFVFTWLILWLVFLWWFTNYVKDNQLDLTHSTIIVIFSLFAWPILSVYYFFNRSHNPVLINHKFDILADIEDGNKYENENKIEYIKKKKKHKHKNK